MSIEPPDPELDCRAELGAEAYEAALAISFLEQRLHAHLRTSDAVAVFRSYVLLVQQVSKHDGDDD